MDLEIRNRNFKSWVDIETKRLLEICIDAIKENVVVGIVGDDEELKRIVLEDTDKWHKRLCYLLDLKKELCSDQTIQSS